MTALDSVIARHWATLIPAPAPAPVDPMHEAMDDYIARSATPSTATPSRPSPPAAGTGGAR